MKSILILLSSLLFAFNAMGATVEVQIPADAKTVVLTASEVVADLCNDYELESLAGWGAATGTYTLRITPTEKACMLPAEQLITLTTESEIDTMFGQPKTLVFSYPADQIPNLKIEFM